MDNSKKIELTPEGRQKLVEELAYREGEKHDEIVERIKEARGFGDLSENSEYDAAKEEQSHNESRINEIRQILSVATVVAAGSHANLKVSAKLGGSSYDDGYSKLNFKAVSQNDIDPNTGEAYNPLLWKSNQDETELFKDWSAHMENATNDIDYLQKAGKLSIAAGASYTTPQEDSTVSATRSSVKSETVNASWQAITAAGKFEKTLDEARTKIDNLGYKEVLKVDQQNAKDLIQARKDIVKQAK